MEVTKVGTANSVAVTYFRSVAIVLAAVFVALFLVPLHPGGDFFIWSAAFDAAHFSIFFFITVLLYRFLPLLRLSSAWNKPLLISVFFVVVTELFQPFALRTASWTDLCNGILGVLAAGFLRHRWAKEHTFISRLFLFLLPCILQVVVSLPLLRGIQLQQWRFHSLPVIATFENPDEILLWKAVTPKRSIANPTTLPASERRLKANSVSGSTALEVRTFSGYQSGVIYLAGGLSWSGYKTLQMSIFNPSQETFTVSVRVDDDTRNSSITDRFNTSIQLRPGENRVEIQVADIALGPRDRRLNIAKIERMFVYVSRDEPSRQFYLDSIQLTR